MKSKVNLHIHTKYSDGGKTVSEVVSKLKEAGIEYFAITDHDKVDGNFEAAEYAEKYKMRHYNGIEISCRFSNGEMGFDDLCGCHILGLGIKIDKMQKKLKPHNEKKNIFTQKLHKALADDGYKLDPINENTTIKSIRTELINKRYAKDKKDCKSRIFCANQYRQYVNLGMDVQTAIQAIKECGGLAIWAHPFKSPGFGRREELNNNQISELLDLLCNYGLDGIEAYYQHFSDCTTEQIIFMESLADSKKLIKSIGTDYHDKERKEEIFFDVEGVIPDETIIARLESRI